MKLKNMMIFRCVTLLCGRIRHRNESDKHDFRSQSWQIEAVHFWFLLSIPSEPIMSGQLRDCQLKPGIRCALSDLCDRTLPPHSEWSFSKKSDRKVTLLHALPWVWSPYHPLIHFHNCLSLSGAVNWYQLHIHPIAQRHTFAVSRSSCCCHFKYNCLLPLVCSCCCHACVFPPSLRSFISFISFIISSAHMSPKSHQPPPPASGHHGGILLAAAVAESRCPSIIKSPCRV